jgi:hypothetical protein
MNYIGFEFFYCFHENLRIVEVIWGDARELAVPVIVTDDANLQTFVP